MDYRSFIDVVTEGAAVSEEEAERVACATLQTLAERISTGEAEDIAERLPSELRTCAAPEGRPERFHRDEFVRRIAERAGVEPTDAEKEARAVFTALWRAVGPDEFADMRAELPRDFDPLLDEAVADEPRPVAPEPPPGVEIRPYDELVDAVARRARVDRERAARATDAVLETLASRITAGQVDDLEALLPPELRPALERGRSRSGGRARHMSVDDFVRMVAELEDVTRGEATEHARAVLAVLRETVGEKEFHDTTEQLPDEYRLILRQG
ncbi:MAG TPA: DUF2267 domain-containing protein [Solirubrobacteraceae bacterium]|jgi:uncharacterized protein (DUF2267 family)